jgi:hypothetical protein
MQSATFVRITRTSSWITFLTSLNVIFLLIIVYSKVCYKDEIVLGLVSVINTITNKENQVELIKKICQPFATEILKVAQEDQGVEKMPMTKKSQAFKTLNKNVGKLSLIVKALDKAKDDATDHPMVEIMKLIWPILQQFMLKYYDQAGLIEVIMKFIKHTIRCLGVLFGPFIEPLFNIIVQNYEVNMNLH